MSKSKGFRSNHAVSLNSGSYAAKLAIVIAQLASAVRAVPLPGHEGSRGRTTSISDNMTPEQFYINMIASAMLVLAGGVFAGLTLGLMGQDEVYLKVIASSGDSTEKRHAQKVLKLIGKGKHWVLVTLLLSNVITNETLPIVLDRCLGGGWPAVVASTASIVIFGEIIPQSICVRYGLQVGAMFSPFVLALMYIMYPVAFPISMLLDHILGEDHGTVYKKSGLKTLVTLHKTMGVERLNQDEVTIISAVLDLKEKPVAHIMTPIDRVYTLSADAVLNEKTVEEIFNAGFSRIPIHLPGEPMNFIGMLLVRVLISYDPEDALPVASFPLATLPETGADTSCLNILNYFQEGKSHMVVVSETPGEPTGAMGVLTLEDVIEELIGEEIVDESDVYVDINKNIRRSQPGPLSKRNLTSYLHNLYHKSKKGPEDNSMSKWKMNFSEDGGSAVHRGEVPVHGAAEAKNWRLQNPADNPINVNKSFVTIKRPDLESVKNNVLAPSKKSRRRTYGSLYGNDEGGDGHASISKSSNGSAEKHSHRFLLPHEKETDVSDISGLSDHGEHRAAPTLQDFYHDHPELDNHGVQILQERSYRTGGIVESVINVQGVHKTIIENVSDESEDDDRESLLTRKNAKLGRKKSSHESDTEEEEPFLPSSSKKANGSFASSHKMSYMESANNSGKRYGVWDKLTSRSNSFKN